MRNIINISLPKEMTMLVEGEIKSGKFATKSEFFRNLIRIWEEKKLLDELKESQREIVSGKGKVLRSLKDLR
jgi:Arc/MetJ-type ribon-helix-helix transcriptional regulator